MLQIRLANASKSRNARYVARPLQNLKQLRELIALRENRTHGADRLAKIQNDAQIQFLADILSLDSTV